jgi:pimeloyl-ACP methyl ester carboxylesterase
MPHATTDDGVKLYYEEAGAGRPLVFVHEYAGDSRSWEPQMRLFSRWYRCIAFNARGYPPSDVPEDPEKYSQARARDDIRSLLDHLAIDRAHVCGLSMGSAWPTARAPCRSRSAAAAMVPSPPSASSSALKPTPRPSR